MALSYSLLFVSFLVGLIGAQMGEAQLGLPNGPINIVRTNGTVFCTANGNANSATTPAFPNAQVQLQCGAGGNVVANVTTSASGNFFISLPTPLIENFTSSVLTDCTVVVTTPLSTCNINLPSVGQLVSALQFVKVSQIGFFRVADLIPAGFQYFNP